MPGACSAILTRWIIMGIPNAGALLAKVHGRAVDGGCHSGPKELLLRSPLYLLELDGHVCP
tara:strand:- start:162 stop:344 length:183 start_codon:yes stop_codon:yes gene_type:complete